MFLDPLLLSHAVGIQSGSRRDSCDEHLGLLGNRINFNRPALYHGVAVLLKPEQTKGFGLFLFAFVLITFLSALGHLMGQLVLQGRLNAVLGT